MKALLLAALLLLMAVGANAQACTQMCQNCTSDLECCKDNGICGCIPNPMAHQGGPPRVCMCQNYGLRDCVAENVQIARAAAAKAAAASGKIPGPPRPALKCVEVPKGRQRRVACTEDATVAAAEKPTLGPVNTTTTANTSSASNTTNTLKTTSAVDMPSTVSTTSTVGTTSTVNTANVNTTANKAKVGPAIAAEVLAP